MFLSVEFACLIKQERRVNNPPKMGAVLDNSTTPHSNCTHSDSSKTILAADANILSQHFFLAFKLCLTCSTIFLNILVITIIQRLNKRKRSFSNFLFLSSAIADLFIGLGPMPSMITYRFFYNSLTGKLTRLKPHTHWTQPKPFLISFVQHRRQELLLLLAHLLQLVSIPQY